MSALFVAQKGVRSTHCEYDAMASRWKMCRDASEGEYTMHQAREAYLPKLSQEDDDAYKSRLMMTPFFNATWRTIVGMRGMLFRKPPAKELPPKMDDFVENIDMAGTPMDTFAQSIAREALTVGRVGILADHPTMTPGQTLADKQQLGVRAFLAIYKAESIYNWRTKTENGATFLSEVRLKECVETEGEDEFSTVSTEQYRVLDLVNGVYRQRLFIIDKQGKDEQVGDDIFPMIGGKNLDFIPFVFIGVDCTGPDVETPPLIDLVTTNIHHYMQATSYERGCFFSGLPTLFISGIDTPEKPISIGGNIANILESSQAKAFYVEVVGNFAALRTNLEDKKREMAILGAQMLEGGKATAAVEAAETVARRQSGEQSVLSAMAQTMSQGLEQALEYIMQFEAIDGEPKYTINRDFLPTTMTADELTALVGAWQNGAMSKQVLFDNLKAGEIIDDATTFEEEEQRIADEAPKLAPAPLALPGQPPDQQTQPAPAPTVGQRPA